MTSSLSSLQQLRCGVLPSNRDILDSTPPVAVVQNDPSFLTVVATSFWKHGMCHVHQNYLQLLWDITKTSTLILSPVAMVFFLGMLAPASNSKGLDYLLVKLALLKEMISTPIHWIYSLPPSSPGMIFLLRPIMDALIFRWLVKLVWEILFKLGNPSQPRHDKEALRWSFLSSFLYGLAHLIHSFSVPSADDLKTRMVETMQTGELVFLGMTLHRRSWDVSIVEYLLKTEPFFQAVGHGVINGVFSWGLLCPLHQMYGLMSSLGAQYAWQVLWLVKVDTQVLIRLFGRIFLPWSGSTDEDVCPLRECACEKIAARQLDGGYSKNQ